MCLVLVLVLVSVRKHRGGGWGAISVEIRAVEDRGTCGAGIVWKGGARVAKEVWCIGREGIGQMVEYAELGFLGFGGEGYGVEVGVGAEVGTGVVVVLLHQCCCIVLCIRRSALSG